MATILEFLRAFRDGMNALGRLEVAGVPMDWLLHLTGAAIIFFIASRFISHRRTLAIAVVILIGKELFDVFAKTRVDYIRPPTLDLLTDLASGGIGIAIGYALARRFPRRSNRSDRAGEAEDDCGPFGVD